jgi:crotonobetaine/carnitine-CoA ligase
VARPAIVDTVLERRNAHADRVYLRFLEREVTWDELAESMWRAANRLREVGVEPGDRVALMMANAPEFLFAYLGALAAGASTVPVNVAQRGAALEHILRDSESVAAVIDDGLVEAARPAIPDEVTLLRRDTVLDAPAEEVEIPRGSRTGLGFMYTSGTTGPPKGVVAEAYDLSHVHDLLGRLGIEAGETIYTALPLFHGNALILSAMGAIWNDWTLALAPRFSASRFLDDIRRYGAVEFTALGAMIPILLKQPERPDDADNPARVCLSAACPGWAWREFERRFGIRIVEFYGLVDYPGYLINDEGVPGSMGRPKGATEFRVVDDEDREVSRGMVGELVMRHPGGRLTHYHNNPQATDEAYRGGWFHTGDLAYVDDDGFFYYAGRKKESMRRKGENISAWEIENAVNQHPAVQECAAHAVASPLGEDEVKLVVVRKPGERVTPQELVDFCTGRMADYAIPSYVEFRESLPKTATHRVEYAALKGEGITPSTWERPAPVQTRR